MFLKSVACLPRRLLFVLPLTASLACWMTTAHAEVTISDQPTHAMKCAKGVCTPKKARANLNVTDLANMLATMDVEVISDIAALDIRFAAPLSWTSTSRLTLDAHRSLTVEEPLEIAGKGAVTLVTNDAGNGGVIEFDASGQIEFWDLQSRLVINGNSYTLVRNLQELANEVANNPSGFYALARNCDASRDGTYTQAAVPTSFGGAFEGLGNTIKKFSLSAGPGNSDFGLFAVNDGVIENLSLARADVSAAQAATAAYRTLGGLVGINNGSVRGVSISGVVEGSSDVNVDDQVGGLVGTNYGVIERSSSSASVKDAAFTGGLVGIMESHGSASMIVNSFATGHVSSRGNAGGLVGASVGENTFVTNSFATGNVDDLLATSFTSANLGGLIGDSAAVISNAFSTGSVKGVAGRTQVGGLVGSNSGAISDAYAKGRVGGATCSACGGLVGTNSGTITASYSTGSISAPSCWCGGLIGSDGADVGSLSHTYWDIQTSGIGDQSKGAGQPANDPGIRGLSTAQFQSELPAGFHKSVWSEDPNINGGYPYLDALPPQ